VVEGRQRVLQPTGAQQDQCSLLGKPGRREPVQRERRLVGGRVHHQLGKFAVEPAAGQGHACDHLQ
jgi:hypothetical protein